MIKNKTSHIFKLISPVILFFFFLFPDVSKAETGKFNIHLETSAGWGLTFWQARELGVGVGVAARMELVLTSWVGIDLGGGFLQFFKGGHPEGFEKIDKAGIVTPVSAGLRFRLINDEKGYLKPWKKTSDHTGNIWGNLWLDLHGNYYYTGDLNRFGGDIGIGYEFSVINGLQLGPFARGIYVYQPDSVNTRDSSDAYLLLAGLSFSVGFPSGARKLKDSDGDGIYDVNDKCPSKPEDMDGFEDKDGCPDNDNDKDSIIDELDECVDVPEDLDGFEDSDGCPDEDNDADGILDSDDKCPDEPEDMDEFEDYDGCPDKDNDADGILDNDDLCPDEPETINKFEDDDGCPEPDRDNDGFADSVDKCPDEPETVNGIDDDDGCPDKGLVEVKLNKILGGDKIYFDFAMARIKAISRVFLNQFVTLLKKHPEYVKISIEGHTDRKGSRDFNIKLSQKRSKRVLKFLVSKGISADRLLIKALGESSVWQTGYDDESMAKNRRVQFVIMELDESLASTPVAPGTKEAMSGKNQTLKIEEKSQERNLEETGDNLNSQKGDANE